MSNKDFTLIGMLLDRSGSMAPLRDDTIGGVNTFIEEQKKVPGRAVLTLAFFDSPLMERPGYELVTSATPIDEMPPLTRNVYVPSGGTALLDGMARMISDLDAYIENLAESERPGSVEVVIVTDGQENESREITKDVLKALVAKRTAGGWRFTFLGANIDAFGEGGAIGARGIGYVASPQGTSHLYAGVSSLVGASRMASAGIAGAEEVYGACLAVDNMSSGQALANNRAFDALLNNVTAPVLPPATEDSLKARIERAAVRK